MSKFSIHRQFLLVLRWRVCFIYIFLLVLRFSNNAGKANGCSSLFSTAQYSIVRAATNLFFISRDTAIDALSGSITAKNLEFQTREKWAIKDKLYKIRSLYQHWLYPLAKFYWKPWSHSDSALWITLWSSFMKTMIGFGFLTLNYPLVKFYCKRRSDSNSPPSITLWSSFIGNRDQIRILHSRLRFGQVLFKTMARFGLLTLDYPLVKFDWKQMSDSNSPPSIALRSSFIENRDQIRILHPRLPFGQVLLKTVVRFGISTLITLWSSLIENGGQIQNLYPRSPVGQILWETPNPKTQKFWVGFGFRLNACTDAY